MRHNKELLEPSMGVRVTNKPEFFKTRHSTLRNFSIHRLYEENNYFSTTKFTCSNDLTLKVNFSVHDIMPGFDDHFIAISEFEYRSFMDVYNLHVEVMMSKEKVNTDVKMKTGQQTFLLTNPFWRMNQIIKQKKF